MCVTFDRFAHYYDSDYRDYDDDIDMILSLARECNGPVLEMGCGTGRIMQHLVEAGHRVVGVDISPDLIAIAQEKLSKIPASEPYVLALGDFTDIELHEHEFTFAFCTSNTLMHVDKPEGQLKAIQNAYDHLAPGGLLLIDLFNPDVNRMLAVNALMELADEWEDEEQNSHVMKWSVRTFDFGEQLQDTLFIYEEVDANGAVHKTVCPFVLRFLWRNEAELMLRHTGFTVEGVWGDFDGSPYDSNSERLILLGVKPLAA